jgi:hypothetical protein
MAQRARVPCPGGCGGTMAKGSILCRRCRRSAITVGVRALVDRAAGTARPAEPSLTDGQRRAIHAKANELDDLHDAPRRTYRTLALEKASEEFGRSIESVNDLTQAEASWVLDRLEERIAAAEASIVS